MGLFTDGIVASLPLHMGGKRSVCLAACLIVVLGSSSALAEEERSDVGDIDLSYLIDGGAIPFIWAPLAGRIALDVYASPRESPMLFNSFEGGAAKAEWEVPGWAISGLGGASALGMVLGGDDSRYYHVKGLAQSLTTGVFVTGMIKVAFGRHRPDWSEDVNTPGSRRSFPSGHATQAFAIATYTGLYLRGHVFKKYRGNKTLPWWEAATYGGLALGATALAGERVVHNRHHLSDVVVGGLLGTAASTLFYIYQDRRYENHKSDAERKQLVVAPAEKGRGGTVGIAWAW